MKKVFILTLLMYSIGYTYAQKKLTSPDGSLTLEVYTDGDIYFKIYQNGNALIDKGELDLSFNKKSLFRKNKLRKSIVTQHTDSYQPAVPFKYSSIKEKYNQLTLSFNKLSVEFRAYNDGVSYRYITKHKGNVKIDEQLDITFSENYKMWTSPIVGYTSSYEVPYDIMKIDEFYSDKNTYLPLLLGNDEGSKILITEVDIKDYPNLFFKKGNEKQLQSTFPPYPEEVEKYEDRRSRITKSGDYIALTSGEREFPWRLMIITEKDADLVESTLTYTLASECKIDDTSWIKPGRVSWEWWNASNLYGVDFKAGFNTETYKYYIDFASKNGLEYIILDEGWSVSTLDLSQPNEELDLMELIQYGKENNVGIILWATWSTLDNQWFVLDKFKEWGAKGIKVDFMDRADQKIVNFYEKVAKLCAEKELLVDFHGAYKPVGLHREYPNVVSYEGVHGLENAKWASTVTPEQNLSLPFIRMVCGPMDYTPGAMRTYHTEEFSPNFDRPAGQGTRSHQIALFIAYESGIQMLCDSPTNYEREKETTSFISKVPVTWDETKVIEAKLGEYLVIARRKENKWFIGGMSDNKGHEFSVKLDFISEGNHNIEIMQDGINADHFAEDYEHIEKTIKNNDILTIKMTKGGGFAAIID